jgi:hypothetical protein
MQQETEPQRNIFRKEGFEMKAYYASKRPSDTKKVMHQVIPFALDTLPLMNPVTVDGVDIPVYEHVSKDRLAIRLGVARVGNGTGKAPSFVHKEEFITENEYLWIACFNKINAEPGDIVELKNVGLSHSDKYGTSIQFDSIRVIPTTEHGLTAADRALIIYRANTRCISPVIPLAANKDIRRIFPRKEKSGKKKKGETEATSTPATTTAPVAPSSTEPQSNTNDATEPQTSNKGIYARNILNTFPLPLLNGIKSNKVALQKLPDYEAVGEHGETDMGVTLPARPKYMSAGKEAEKGQEAKLAEVQFYTEAYVGQLREIADEPESFHIQHSSAYASSIIASPTLYPVEFDALMKRHPTFPVSVIAGITLNDTINNPLNYSHESLRGEMPDGDLQVRFHSVVLNTERALLELGIPCTFGMIQERYGGNGIMTSVPYVQDDRVKIYAAHELKAAFTNSKTDKVLAFDAAPLSLGDPKTMLYFAFPLKDELNGLDEIEDRSLLTPEQGDELIRLNKKKISEGILAKLAHPEKIHVPWLTGEDKSKYPSFVFLGIERAYAEKLLSMAGKPLELASFFTPPKDLPPMAADAVNTVDEFRFKHLTKLAADFRAVNGDVDEDGDGDDEDEPFDYDNMDVERPAKKGTKRSLEEGKDGDGDSGEGPDTKKQRTLPNFDDEKARSGFEDDDNNKVNDVKKDSDGDVQMGDDEDN